MLSRENRILSELIVGHGLARAEAVERRARELEHSDEHDLVAALVSHGELDPAAGRSLREEASAIDALFRTEPLEGKTLGEYRLVREIGRGGMGIVYEAEQPSLGRRVALKVLPAGAALDEQLAIRFLREARTAARLTHPGIVPVFGTGHEQGVLFFAMELVCGETLAQRIDRGPLAPRDAARIASEIARALHHAHEAGLIHRDVKPENVIIGPDGRSRLADFGLVHDLRGARLTHSQYVLGTPAYTAPEQARAAAVDLRSDVYGLGAVLYAMLAGKPPFEGEVGAAVLGRLINGPPPALLSVAPGTPPALVAICERAMARERDARYPSAHALAEALDGFLAAVHVDRPAASRVAPGLAAAALVAVAAAGYFWLRAPQLGPSGIRDGSYRLMPTAAGSKGSIALSPDGETLAYVTAPVPRLLVQRPGEAEPRRLASHEEPQSMPAWSPDGSRIAYCRSDRLEIITLASGEAQSTDAPCGPMSWSPDGSRIVYSHRPKPVSRLAVLDIASGVSRMISAPGAFWPAWSAGGRIAFVALHEGQYDLWTMREDGNDARRVTNDAAREVYPAWSSRPGILYYGSNRDESPDLWKVRLDPASGAVLSEPARLTQGWFGAPFELSLARERERLAFVHEIDLTQSWLLRLDAQARPLGPPQNPRLDLPFDGDLPQRSPVSEDWIVADRRGEAENLRGLTTWLTDGPYRDGAPRWSPDGRSIAFHSDRSGTTQIWTVGADGTGLAQITNAPAAARHPIWSPDGARLAYSVDGSGAWVQVLDGQGPTALLAGFEPWSWSTDGSKLAGTADGILVLDVTSGSATRVAAYGERPSWVGDSDALLFTHEDRIFLWGGRGEPRAIWSTGPNRLSPGLSLAAGGREVVFATTASTERVWSLDLDAAFTE